MTKKAIQQRLLSVWNYVKGKEFLFVTGVFLFTRIVIIVIGVISYMFFAEKVNPFYYDNGVKTFADALDFEEQWDKFDSGWYLSIAKNGYTHKPFSADTMENWGFMPLYPLLVWGAAQVLGPHHFVIGAVLSNIFSLAAVLLLTRFVRERFGKTDILVLALLMSAGTFFLSIPYTEGLFLLLSVMVFYLTYRKQYWLAVIVCGLAMVTRLQGVALFLIPTIEILFNDRKSFWKTFPFYFLSAIPLFLFMYHLYTVCGEPLAFIKIQSAWGASSLYPLQAFVSIFHFGKGFVVSAVNAAFWLIYIIIYVLNIKKLPWSYTVYSIVYFLLSTSTEVVYGTTRYVLCLIPAFIAVTFLSKRLLQGYMFLNVMFLALSITMFVTSIFLFV